MSAIAFALALIPISIQANDYTNHAGHVISGFPVALTKRTVEFASAPADFANEAQAKRETTTYPLSIFPESERRRIAADFGEPILPPDVKRAIEASESARRRSAARAAKGLCSKEESEDFRCRSTAALAAYLEKQLAAGNITEAEFSALQKRLDRGD